MWLCQMLCDCTSSHFHAFPLTLSEAVDYQARVHCWAGSHLRLLKTIPQVALRGHKTGKKKTTALTSSVWGVSLHPRKMRPQANLEYLQAVHMEVRISKRLSTSIH